MDMLTILLSAEPAGSVASSLSSFNIIAILAAIFAVFIAIIKSILPIAQFIITVLGVPFLWLSIKALKKYLKG